jgi:N-acetylglucosamine-6-sulfatase
MDPSRKSWRLQLTVTLFSICACAGSLYASADKPNILFIMADDHTTQAIGVYGSRLAGLNPTPNIDRMAQQGMRFDGVFCTNSICCPSRATILTGPVSTRKTPSS